VFYPFDVAGFSQEVDRMHLSLQAFVRSFGFVDSHGRGSCTVLVKERNAWIQSVGFVGAPEPWQTLYVEYRRIISDAVAVTQPIADICAGGGGTVTDEQYRTVVDTVDAAQNRMYAVQLQIASLR
jgi:hypothetical protein